MTFIASILTAVTLILPCHVNIAKESSKLLHLKSKDKASISLQKDAVNGSIYRQIRFHVRKRRASSLGGYRSRPFPSKDDKISSQFYNSLKLQEPAESATKFHNSFILLRGNLHGENRNMLGNKQLYKRNYYSGKNERNTIANRRTRLRDDYALFRFMKTAIFTEPERKKVISPLRRSLRNALLFNRYEMNENSTWTNEIRLETKRTFLLPPVLNKLREALLVHPFKTWKLRNKLNSMQDIRAHEDILHDVIRNPFNWRLVNKLYKVIQGKHVYLDLFGGSNSVGAGLMNDEGSMDGRYPKVILDWWNKTITSTTGSNLLLREIAMGGTSSEFLQFCFISYIHENLDLVFIEMSVNDVRDLPSNANKSLPLEQLTRQLLAYPSEPAVVYINLFNGVYCDDGCTNLEDYGQGLISDTYNITSLKWRDVVCSNNTCNSNIESPHEMFGSDGMHINQLAHRHISLMIINLFRRILLYHISTIVTNPNPLSETNRENYSMDVSREKHLMTKSREDQLIARESSRKLVKLPPRVFINKATNIISKPLCWTRLLPNYHRANEIKNTLDVVIKQTKGFYLENSTLGAKCVKKPCRVDAHSSWTGKTVGASMTFAVKIPRKNFSLGMGARSAEKMETRAVVVAARTCPACGAADIWLNNDDANKKLVNAKLIYGRTITAIIALHVKPGDHNLNLEIVREGKFSLVAVMVGPPDGPY